MRKKPIKYDEYQYSAGSESDYHPSKHGNSKRRYKRLNSDLSYNRADKERKLRNSKDKIPQISYDKALKQIIYQSHMLKEVHCQKIVDFPKGKVIKVKNSIKYLLEQYKPTQLMAVFIDLIHVNDSNLSSKGSKKARISQLIEKLKIKRSLLNDGMLFVLCENQDVARVMNNFAKQEFKYAENQAIIPLDPEYQHKQQLVKGDPISKSIDIYCTFINKGANHFCVNNSWTLLMLRRWGPSMKSSLVIQHQRTCDTCLYFDYGKDSFPWNQVYTTVETLLPKSRQAKECQLLKLWGEDGVRDGWIKILEEVDP